MCLATKQFFPRISFKRIPIYKIVYENPDTNELFTWVRFARLTSRAKGFFFLPTKENGGDRYKYIIEGGMIHAFSTMDWAKANCTYSYKIIEGYIPPFTRYYVGISGDICAKRMKYLIEG